MSMYYTIRISDDVLRSYNGINIFCAMTNVTIRKDYTLDKFVYELERKIAVSKEILKDHPAIRALRDFYWRMGIDPTKTRPSSEALARRFLLNKNIPKINNVVDAGNIASIETLVPIGTYDADKIVGDVILRFPDVNEEFIDVSNKKHLLLGKEIVLADETGIMHVFPYRDAYRTRVNDDTKKVLIVGCGVPGIEQGLTRIAVDRTIELINILGA
ncbi:MAG: phenylalanine--tRNA ligase beta subunit-related protein [Nitrososphaerales archaeon]